MTPRATRLEDVAGRSVGRFEVATLALAFLSAAAAVTLFVAGRGLIFFYDEWSFVLYRRGYDLDSFLEPHNGHLSLVPVSIYKLLFELVGLEHYGPYRLTVIALHIVCAWLVFLLLRQEAGRVLALLGSGLVLFLGTAWQDLLWPFQIGYLASVAGGLAALLGVRRGSDGTAAAGVSVSLASSGLGVPFAAGVFAALALQRATPRRWLVLLVPTGAYAVWYLAYGESQASPSNLPRLPRYVIDSYTGAMGQASGIGLEWGQWLGAVAAAAAVVVVRRRTWRQAVPPLIVVLTFWSLTALSRAQFGEPAASRYIYPGTILLLLVAGALLAGVRPAAPLLGLLAIGVVLAVASNLRTLEAGAAGLRETGAYVVASLTAVELQRAVVPDEFVPDNVRAPQIAAGAYLDAAGDLGSPALPVAHIPAQPRHIRTHVDAVLLQAVGDDLVVRGEAPQSSSRPVVDGAVEGVLRQEGGCVTFTPRSASTGSRVEVVVPAGGLAVSTDSRAMVFVRRFADEYPARPSGSLGSGTSIIDPPEDSSATSWRVRIAPVAATTVCGAT